MCVCVRAHTNVHARFSLGETVARPIVLHSHSSPNAELWWHFHGIWQEQTVAFLVTLYSTFFQLQHFFWEHAHADGTHRTLAFIPSKLLALCQVPGPRQQNTMGACQFLSGKFREVPRASGTPLLHLEWNGVGSFLQLGCGWCRGVVYVFITWGGL